MSIVEKTKKEKKADFLVELNAFTGKKYKTIGVGVYDLFKQITLKEDLRLTQKTVADFLNDDKGKPDPEQPNADAGATFWQGILPDLDVPVKVKTDLVDTNSKVLPAGTYNLFIFAGDIRPSFAISDGSTYSKLDALTPKA